MWIVKAILCSQTEDTSWFTALLASPPRIGLCLIKNIYRLVSTRSLNTQYLSVLENDQVLLQKVGITAEL